MVTSSAGTFLEHQESQFVLLLQDALLGGFHFLGSDVIYIRHIIQNLLTNRLLFGYSIAGTEGAELYSGLEIVSEYCFDKLFGDALTNKKLLAMIHEQDYDMLHLCGLDEYGCVTATALGAVKRGIPVRIVRSGTATVLPEKKAAKQRKKLEQAGIMYI